MGFEILVPPIVGGVIGYITNDIAIKMLFRPRKAKFIGKWQIPFTPGLIPKEKSRIAGSIGNVISKQLLDSETLSDVLSSDEMTTKIRQSIENFVAKNEENTHTLYYALTQYVQEDTLRVAYENVRDDISDFAYEKITETNFVKNFAEEMLYWVRDAIFFVRIPLLDRLVGDKIAKSIIEPIAEKISSAINAKIFEDGGALISKTIDKESKDILEYRICDLIHEHKYEINDIIDFLMQTYKKIVTENLSDIIEGLDIAKIVEDKINAFDEIELEKMIFGIMKRELNAIIWLGALLGFIMGWLNLIVR